MNKQLISCILFFILFVIIFYFLNEQENIQIARKRRAIQKKQLTKNLIAPQILYSFKTKIIDGVPMISININNTSFFCIFDTGSSQINLSHKSCDGCNKKDGVYKDKIDENNQFIIEYGSQIDTVVEEQATLFLKQPHDVSVFLTIGRESGQSGDSNHNVFGAMQHYSKHLHFLKNECIYCNFNNKNKQIIFCNNEYLRQILLKKKFISLNLKSHNLYLPFYIIPIFKIVLNNDETFFTINNCIVDTGSNQSTFPNIVGSRIIKKIKKYKNPSIKIYFTKNKFIRLSYPDLFWTGTNYVMIDNDNSALSRAQQHNTMILGTYNIRNRDIIFSNKQFFIQDI